MLVYVGRGWSTWRILAFLMAARNSCPGSSGRSPAGRTLAHLAQDICLCGAPAGHHRYPRCLAQPCAAPVARAVADQGVPACRDLYRVGSTRADENITVNAGARHGHGPRPRTRQPRCRAADSIQVTSQGAIGGVLRRARRREPGQEHSSQGQTDQGDSHSPWTKRACRAVPGVRRMCASACHGPFGQ